MNKADDNRPIRELLQIQLDELKRRFCYAMQLSEIEGKSGVIRYLSREFDAFPIEQGNDVLIGSKIVRFDDKGNFIGFNDHNDLKSTAVRKLPPNADCDGRN